MDKDKVWELTRLSHLDVYGMGKDREKFLATLQYFVAMVEREVRGDAEPVAWQFYDAEMSKWFWGYDTHNHRGRVEAAGYKTRDLFAHPTSAVVRLTNKEIIDLYETSELAGSYFETGTEKAIAVAHAVMKAMEEKAPAVVRQLVEALESLLNDVGRANSMLGAVKARAALAAAKENGL